MITEVGACCNESGSLGPVSTGLANPGGNIHAFPIAQTDSATGPLCAVAFGPLETTPKWPTIHLPTRLVDARLC